MYSGCRLKKKIIYICCVYIPMQTNDDCGRGCVYASTTSLSGILCRMCLARVSLNICKVLDLWIYWNELLRHSKILTSISFFPDLLIDIVRQLMCALHVFASVYGSKLVSFLYSKAYYEELVVGILILNCARGNNFTLASLWKIYNFYNIRHKYVLLFW